MSGQYWKHFAYRLIGRKVIITQMVLKPISKKKQNKQNKTKIYPTLFTVFPSMMFVNIMICSMCSCQTMNQKSATVFCLGPREKVGGK